MTTADNNPNSKLFHAIASLDVEAAKTAIAEGAQASNPHRESGHGPDGSSVIANFVDSMRGGMMMRMGSNSMGRVTSNHRKEFAERMKQLLELLRDEGGLDANTNMEDGRTLLMASAEYAGSLPGDLLVKFLIENGADASQKITQQLDKWDQKQGKRVPTNTQETDVLASMVSAHGEFHHYGYPSDYASQMQRAGTIARLVKAGAPLDGEVNDWNYGQPKNIPVLSKILQEQFPEGSLAVVIGPILEQVNSVYDVAGGEQILPTVLKQSTEAIDHRKANFSGSEISEAFATLGGEFMDTNEHAHYSRRNLDAIKELVEKILNKGVDLDREIPTLIRVDYDADFDNGPDLIKGKHTPVYENLKPIEIAARANDRVSRDSSLSPRETLVMQLLQHGAQIPERLANSEYANGFIKITFANQQIEAGKANATKLLEREVQNSDGKINEKYVDHLLELGAQVSDSIVGTVQKYTDTITAKDRSGRTAFYTLAKMKLEKVAQEGGDELDVANAATEELHNHLNRTPPNGRFLSDKAVSYLIHKGCRVDRGLAEAFEKTGNTDPADKFGYDVDHVDTFLNIAYVQQQKLNNPGLINEKDENGRTLLDREIMASAKPDNKTRFFLELAQGKDIMQAAEDANYNFQLKLYIDKQEWPEKPMGKKYGDVEWELSDLSPDNVAILNRIKETGEYKAYYDIHSHRPGFAQWLIEQGATVSDEVYRIFKDNQERDGYCDSVGDRYTVYNHDKGTSEYRGTNIRKIIMDAYAAQNPTPITENE